MSKVFGILACPVGHSLSPVMQSAAFREVGFDATYESFEIPPADLAVFMQQVRDGKISGLSVSIPYKVTIIQYLDRITPDARKIGAINTIYLENNQLIGANTDWIGALDTLENKMKVVGKRVVVLGNGGAARAIVFGLQEYHAGEIIVLGRSLERLADLIRDFGVKTDSFDNLDEYSPDIIINTTPLGMQGEHVDDSPVPVEYFEAQQPLIYDIVYRPLETKLLREAVAVGCQTLGGLGMLVQQGIHQFEIWTGKQAPVKVMQKAVEKALE